jgi:hypothetical protein
MSFVFVLHRRSDSDIQQPYAKGGILIPALVIVFQQLISLSFGTRSVTVHEERGEGNALDESSFSPQP